MNGKTGEPVPIWGTVLGVCLALGVGVGGFLLALDSEHGFTAADALFPAVVGFLVGLVLAGLALWLYFAKHWPADSRIKFLSVLAFAGLGILLASAPPAVIVGASAAGSALLLPLMIVGGAVSRRRGADATGKRPQEPDTPAGI